MTENNLVLARSPGEARAVASADSWFVLTCGPAIRNSPADYGLPRIEVK